VTLHINESGKVEKVFTIFLSLGNRSGGKKDFRHGRPRCRRRKCWLKHPRRRPFSNLRRRGRRVFFTIWAAHADVFCLSAICGRRPSNTLAAGRGKGGEKRAGGKRKFWCCVWSSGGNGRNADAWIELDLEADKLGQMRDRRCGLRVARQKYPSRVKKKKKNKKKNKEKKTKKPQDTG